MSCDPLATPPPFGPPRAQPGVPAPQPRPAAAASDPRAVGPLPYDPGCDRTLRLNGVTGLLADVVRQHFADPQNVFDPNLRAACSPARSGDPPVLPVTIAHVFDVTYAGRRPAVQVRRMDVTGQRVVVNDRAGETRTGTVLMQLWKGSHTLYCWHDTTTGADELADEVAGVLAAAAHVVGPPAGVTLHPAQIGATDDKMAQAKGCCVPVSVGWEVPRLWLVRQEGRGLRMAVRPARRLG